ncbi:hypothetical protein CR513_62730, partial [Mucuna pruriens]
MSEDFNATALKQACILFMLDNLSSKPWYVLSPGSFNCTRHTCVLLNFTCQVSSSGLVRIARFYHERPKCTIMYNAVTVLVRTTDQLKCIPTQLFLSLDVMVRAKCRVNSVCGLHLIYLALT